MNGFLAFILFLLLIFYEFSAHGALRDPTQPNDLFLGNQEYRTGLEVSAIILSPQKRIAVINGVIVKEGDQVFGNKVVGIHANSVQLESTNGRMFLFLIKQPVKKKAF